MCACVCVYPVQYTMVRKQISSQISMCTFAIVLLLVEIFHEAACLVDKPNSISKDSLDQNLNEKLHQYYYKSGPNITNVATIEDDDPNYPYEQLLKLVEDTKRIIRSTNITEKMQLNLDPLLYDNYLNGDLSDSNLDFNISPDIPPFAGGGYVDDYNSCPVDVQYRIPKRLRATDGKEYFIVNVGQKLRQKYNTVICKYPRKSCGSIAQPQSYSYECDQTFNRIRSFVSIPVNDQISLEQQRTKSFQLPDSCVCKRSRNIP